MATLPASPTVGTVATATTGNTLTCTIPTCSVGDLLLFVVTDFGGSPSAPSGWSSVATATSQNAGAPTQFSIVRTYSRVAESGDSGGSVALSSVGTNTKGAVLVLAPVRRSAAIKGSATATNTAEVASLAAGTVAGTESPVRTIVVSAARNAAGASLTMPGSGLISAAQDTGSPAYVAFYVSTDTSSMATTRTVTPNANALIAIVTVAVQGAGGQMAVI